MKIILQRADDLGKDVAGRLSGISEIVAEETRYHIVCKSRFISNLAKPYMEAFTKVS